MGMKRAYVNYPHWAPKSLVELHKKRLESDDYIAELQKDGKWKKSLNPDDYIAELRKDEKYKTATEETFARIKEEIYRKQLFLPKDESDTLLGKLLTDQRMRDVWLSLARRRKQKDDENRFWLACERAIVGWRGEPKITQKERQQLLIEIPEYLGKILNNMHRLRDFEHYSLLDLVDDKSIDWLLEVLDADLSHKDEPERIGYARFALRDVIPSIDSVMIDIYSKALEYSEEEMTVKKPNSENAAIHYFVRMLSRWFQDYFGQPLHDSVASTTCVALDVQNIDSDYVRKLVNS